MQKYLFIGIAVLIAFLVLRPKSTTSNSKKTAPEQGLTAKSAAKPSIELLPSNTNIQPRPTAQVPGPEAVKASGSSRQAGFNKLDLNKVDGHWILKLKFASTIKKCEMGDLDLIRIDQKRRGIRSLIVSLDDMEHQKKLFHQAIEPNSLIDQSLTIRWKAEDKPRALALQICSDAQSNQSCLAAKSGDINQPLNPKDPSPMNDRVYYFQLIQEGSVVSLLDASRAQAKDAKLLASAFTTAGLPAGSASQLAQEVAQKHIQIGSMAASFRNKELRIDLPHNDPACPLPHLKF